MRLHGRLARLERVRLDQSKRAEPPPLTDAELVEQYARIITAEPHNDRKRRRQDGLRYLLERVRARQAGAENNGTMPRFWLGES